MPVAKGRLIGPTGKQIEVNILLDPASDQSFIDKATSEALELQGSTVELSIGGITGHVDEAKTRRLVKATIKNRHHLEKYKEVELIELPVIFDNLSRPGVTKQVLESKYINNLQLADDYTQKNDCNINVLIGLNHYYSVVSGRIRRAPEKPIALESMFGWVLVSDSSNTSSAGKNIICMVTSTREENQISQQLKRFWEIEEIYPEQKMKWSPSATKTFSEFKSSIEYKDKKYTVKLPMIEKELDVTGVDDKLSSQDNNKSLALNRFNKRQKRFNKDPKFEEMYSDAVTEYIDAGYTEKVVEDMEPKDCFYIPHQVVIK